MEKRRISLRNKAEQDRKAREEAERVQREKDGRILKNIEFLIDSF